MGGVEKGKMGQLLGPSLFHSSDPNNNAKEYNRASLPCGSGP